MPDGTQYLIDIASEIAGADDAATQLVRLAKELDGIGDEVEAFDAAIAQATDALTEQDVATKATRDALKAAQKQYRELERAAKQGSEGAAAALNRQAEAVFRLKIEADSAVAKQKRLASSLKALRAAGKEAASLNDAADAAARGSREFGPMASALGALGGPLGTAGQRAAEFGDAFANLGSTLGGAGGVVGLVVIAGAAIIAVTAAIVAATAATAAWGVRLADTARTLAINVAALETAKPRLEGIGKLLPGLRRDTGLANEELLDLGKQLDAAKIPARDMPDALRAIAIAESALGNGAAADLVKQLKSGKKTAAELAREVDAKFGGIVAKRLLGLDKQSERLKQNIGETFGGLDIEPLLKGLTVLVALFDKNTAAGETLKFLFESIFQPLINAATAAIPVIEAFVLGLLIGAVKIYTAFRPLIRVLGDVFGFEDTSLADTLTVAATLGKAFAFAIGAAAAVFVAAMTQMAFFIGIPIAGFALLVTAAQAAWDGLKTGAQAVLDFLEGFSLADVGRAMIEGLAGGIAAAGSLVVDAMGGVVQGAIDSAKALLKIGSPSKLFEELGGFTAEGFAGGVEGESGKAQSALEAMVSPPKAEGAGGRGGSGPVTVNLTINAPDGSAEGIAAKVREVLVDVFEGDLSQLSPEGAPA